MKVLAVVGTRPEIIKTAPVVAALRERGAKVYVSFTGQHTTLVDQMLPTFPCMAPDVVNVVPKWEPLYEQAVVLRTTMRCIRELKPEVLLVQGDTASAYFAALSGFFDGIPIAHIEAGLRSGHPRLPFPEEQFRRQIDVMSHWRFAPTLGAMTHLVEESLYKGAYITGNTVVDAVQSVKLPEQRYRSTPYALLTLHRRENWGAPASRVFEAVSQLGVDIVYPVHPSMRPQAEAECSEPIQLCEPLLYDESLHAVRDAAIVLTDSGGIQEECSVLGTPCLVLRDQTERPEAGGTLVGTNTETIKAYGYAATDGLPYPYNGALGDGTAGKRIAEILCS